MLRVGIIGTGLIGVKRARSLSDATLVAVCDKNEDRARSLAGDLEISKRFQPSVERDAHSLIQRKDLDAILIATANDAIPDLASRALQSGKHVLIEKPGGRNPTEVRRLASVAQECRRILRVGFNHRFHPAFIQAKRLMKESRIGPLMYIRGRYGHGGRLGYDQEWRAQPELSGGGELLDQGVHLIDLCRWLGGEFQLEYGHVQTFFWKMPVEDNGFLLLRSPDQKRAAFLHASCTEWKNLFDFEIFCREAKIQVWGLGRSYGTEELRVFQMKPEMGPPEVSSESFPGEDRSWDEEFRAFQQEISGARTEIGTIQDAVRCLEIVYAAYEKSS